MEISKILKSTNDQMCNSVTGVSHPFVYRGEGSKYATILPNPTMVALCEIDVYTAKSMQEMPSNIDKSFLDQLVHTDPNKSAILSIEKLIENTGTYPYNHNIDGDKKEIVAKIFGDNITIDCVKMYHAAQIIKDLKPEDTKVKFHKYLGIRIICLQSLDSKVSVFVAPIADSVKIPLHDPAYIFKMKPFNEINTDVSAVLAVNEFSDKSPEAVWGKYFGEYLS
jgi:hypothetical protein